MILHKPSTQMHLRFATPQSHALALVNPSRLHIIADLLTVMHAHLLQLTQCSQLQQPIVCQVRGMFPAQLPELLQLRYYRHIIIPKCSPTNAQPCAGATVPIKPKASRLGQHCMIPSSFALFMHHS